MGHPRSQNPWRRLGRAAAAACLLAAPLAASAQVRFAVSFPAERSKAPIDGRLRRILERDWKTLGPKLRGKIHIYVGDMDNYYLNNAVYLMEAFLESTKDPHYDGEVDYGDRAEHCWNGDHDRPNAISRLRYHQMYIPRAVKRMEETAPAGADLKSWRY